MSPVDRVCLGNMCMDTLHKGDNDDEDYDDDNDNNNIYIFIHISRYFIYIFGLS